jgi:hypothetical protein
MNNISVNNITVLDQSYFAFDSNTFQITQNTKPKETYTIAEEKE